MLIPEPSWLNPSRFIDASQAGAALGLGRAKMFTDANEAAGRLGLGYAQMGQQAQEAAGRLSAAREEAAGRIALAQANEEKESAYQNAGLALRERAQAFDEQQAAAKALLPQSVMNVKDFGEGVGKVLIDADGKPHFIPRSSVNTPPELIPSNLPGFTGALTPGGHYVPPEKAAREDRPYSVDVFNADGKKTGTRKMTTTEYLLANPPQGNINFGDLPTGTNSLNAVTAPEALNAGSVSLQAPTDAVTAAPPNPAGAVLTAPTQELQVAPATGNRLTKEQAKQFLIQAGRDRKKAEQLAKEAGYDF